ncbi:hypothetical protein Theco_4011 (plasmid) [Thermobacillus composti KWC4]|uniref:Uncharacterized protein n=1 Tax=Thermobacillus composti (strain DSM 18247 / JCM 13945 / KWC4) TaxID=717605 RepID=L0EL50_THECK|nr:hypothetical protein Theco_4011 [Thermobacillus composti KWC4]
MYIRNIGLTVIVVRECFMIDCCLLQWRGVMTLLQFVIRRWRLLIMLFLDIRLH